jgi:hypothetical protein
MSGTRASLKQQQKKVHHTPKHADLTRSNNETRNSQPQEAIFSIRLYSTVDESFVLDLSRRCPALLLELRFDEIEGEGEEAGKEASDCRGCQRDVLFWQTGLPEDRFRLAESGQLSEVECHCANHCRTEKEENNQRVRDVSRRTIEKRTTTSLQPSQSVATPSFLAIRTKASKTLL